MTKIEKAKAIVAAHANASRQELIALFMSELSMSKAGATTYYYNATAETREPSTRMKNKDKRLAVVAKANASAKPKTTAEAVATFAKRKAKTAEQWMSEAEKAAKAKAKAEQSAAIHAELDKFVEDIDSYDFPHGTLSDPEHQRKAAQREKNLELMKEVSAKRKGGNYIVV